MTTDELVAIFVGLVTAITTVVGGSIRSSRATRLRKSIAEDLAILQGLPPGQAARPALQEGVQRQSAELAALVLHPTRTSAYFWAFLAFVFWGVVLIVYVTEGWGPLLFAEGVGRGLVNWFYVVAGAIAVILFLRGARAAARERARERDRILGED